MRSRTAELGGIAAPQEFPDAYRCYPDVEWSAAARILVCMADAAIRTVAIFNSSDDTVDMLSVLLTLRGYRAISGRADDVKSGELNFIDFLSAQKPHAVVWDIAPPYDRNWNFFALVRSIGPLQHCPIVLTTTHRHHLDSVAGQDTGAIEIVGKPYDIEVIVHAVTRSIERAGDSVGPRAIAHARQ